MDRKKIAKELGKAGGEKTKLMYGTEHYRKIINKRWEKEREKQKKEVEERST